jgi:phage terminase small subunit
MTDDARPLKPKQRVFVEAYLRTWCAAEAARTAGYAHPDRQGSRLLKNVEVQAAIEARLKDMAMGADEILARMTDQAQANIGDFWKVKQVPLRMKDGIVFDKDGNPVMVDVWDLDMDEVKARGHLIKTISMTKFGPRIELHDGQAALVQLGKHRKLFVDRHEITGENGGPIEVDAGIDRALRKIYGDHSNG